MKKSYLITTLLVVLALLFVSCDNPASPETPDAGVDKTTLTEAIADAETLLASVSIGTAIGNVSQSTYDTYSTAIADAKTVEGYSSPTQTEIDNALSDLAAATVIFNSNIRTSALESSTAGTVNFASGFDTWGSGTVIEAPYVDDIKYDSVIKATSGFGWYIDAICVAFMNTPANGLLRYTNLEFKIKSSDYTTVKVQMTGANPAEPQFSLSDATYATALDNGWIQMSIPLTVFGTLALNQTQFAILEHNTAGTLYIADVEFTGLKAIDASYLQGVITEAETLNTAHAVGTGDGDVPSAAKTDFDAAIANANSVATAAASWDSLDAEIVTLTAAIVAFEDAIIRLAPATVPAPTTALADVGYVLWNSDSQYSTATQITVNNWTPGWGEVGAPTTEVIDGKTVNKFTTLGWAIAQTATFDATTHHYFHADFYAPAGDHFLIKINSGGVEKQIPIDSTTTPAFAAGSWISIDVDLTTLFGSDPIDSIEAIVFAGNVTSPFTEIVYLDNVYFHQ